MYFINSIIHNFSWKKNL